LWHKRIETEIDSETKLVAETRALERHIVWEWIMTIEEFQSEPVAEEAARWLTQKCPNLAFTSGRCTTLSAERGGGADFVMGRFVERPDLFYFQRPMGTTT
jgi:hypothetical protein